MVLTRDKRTSKKLLLTEGYILYQRYRLFAVNTNEHPDSVEKCKAYYGTTSVYPLDIYLGVDKLPFKISVDAALRLAKIGATSPSYKDASERLMEDFELPISADEIREIVDYVGEIVLLEDQRLTDEAVKTYNLKTIRSEKRGRRPKDGFTLYCEVDGAMFNTRKSTKEKSPGKDSSSEKDNDTAGWKENKLGIVFRSDDLIETGERDDHERPVLRLGKREYICSTQGVENFRERLLYLMMKNGLADASNVVLISDGAPWIRKTREQYFPGATQILDLFHLKENVMKFAQYIHNNRASLYKPWWSEVCSQLENGLWKDVLSRPEVSVYKEEKDTPKGIVNLYQYISNNSDFIDYPTYRSKGYFVGSGAIESGNKTVLQERLKLAGMRWYMSTAEGLLALRAKLKSGLWESDVVPLVRSQYSERHLSPDSIRQSQRKKHRKPPKQS